MYFQVTVITGLHVLPGQLERKDVTVTGDVSVRASKGMMTVVSSEGQSQIKVRASGRYDRMARGGVKCWLIKGDNNPLLDGTKQDYYTPGQNILYDQLVPGLVPYVNNQGVPDWIDLKQEEEGPYVSF